jgi:two-component system phosphate regulon sensor histidine kinase PhoR
MRRRSLLILLTTIVALPAAALVYLGLRLLQQDRELERQRRAEILQEASSRAVSAFERELSALTLRLSDSTWLAAAPSDGSIHVVMTHDDMRIVPAHAVAYWPIPTKLETIPETAFKEADSAEFLSLDPAAALALNRELRRSGSGAVRAGALVREARILRKMGRLVESLNTYDLLAAIDAVAINGMPSDLQARKTRCQLLESMSNTDALRREAALIDADLKGGRWHLDRETYEYVSSLVGNWLGPSRADDERIAFAAAAAWLRREWSGGDQSPRSNGWQVVPGAMPLTVIWSANDERVTAVIANASFVEKQWLPGVVRAAAPAIASLLPGAAGSPRSPLPSPDPPAIVRSAAETGLPWAISVALPDRANAAQFESRRRTLLAALAAVLVMVAAGSYVVVRARAREMAVARLQSDFVTAVSHEFRTPLTALIQFNDLLEEGTDPPAEKQQIYLRAQRRATERLQRLVESLLDFGRMEAGRRMYAMEPLDAGLLVRDVVDEFQRQIERREVSIHCEADASEQRVEADADALVRAVWNLLDNAVKYAGDSRDIHVAVRGTSSGVAIIVRDQGIGIPAAEQSRIFQKFTRGTAASSRRIRGTGVGLAMVQHIVAGHRGTLNVDSIEGQGSTFTIVLPHAAAAHPPGA